MLTPVSGWRAGSWHPCCGWVWDTASGTARILDTLVKRGLASVTPLPHSRIGEYTITPAGLAVLESTKITK